MYYQNEPGIYVYERERFLIVGEYYYDSRIVATHYPTLEDFFYCHNERDIKNRCGYHIGDNKCQEMIDCRPKKRCGTVYYYDKKYCHKVNCREHDNSIPAYAVYDQDGNLYTPDRLIGLWRKRIQERRKQFHYPKRSKRAWGHFRKIRTLQERKWAHAWDDEEFAPKIRAARQGKNLPDAWDDYSAHNDKCWKTQSKRRRQWKPK